VSSRHAYATGKQLFRAVRTCRHPVGFSFECELSAPVQPHACLTPPTAVAMEPNLRRRVSLAPPHGSGFFGTRVMPRAMALASVCLCAALVPLRLISRFTCGTHCHPHPASSAVASSRRFVACWRTQIQPVPPTRRQRPSIRVSGRTGYWNCRPSSNRPRLSAGAGRQMLCGCDGVPHRRSRLPLCKSCNGAPSALRAQWSTHFL